MTSSKPLRPLTEEELRLAKKEAERIHGKPLRLTAVQWLVIFDDIRKRRKKR